MFLGLEELAVNLHNFVKEVQRPAVIDAFLLTEFCSTARIKSSHETSVIFSLLITQEHTCTVTGLIYLFINKYKLKTNVFHINSVDLCQM